MDFSLLLKGFIIGLSIAAPVGPIGVLCIRRTLNSGRLSGLLSGLGAATADGFYGSIAAFGLTAISSFLTGQQFWLRLIGGMFLLYLGIRTFFSKPATTSLAVTKQNLLRDYASTLFLTITNPLTILSFAAIFAGVGSDGAPANTASAATMVAGVVAGSAAWWLILSGSVSFLRTRVNDTMLGIINKVSGVTIVIFAILAFVGLIKT